MSDYRATFSIYRQRKANNGRFKYADDNKTSPDNWKDEASTERAVTAGKSCSRSKEGTRTSRDIEKIILYSCARSWAAADIHLKPMEEQKVVETLLMT